MLHRRTMDHLDLYLWLSLLWSALLIGGFTLLLV